MEDPCPAALRELIDRQEIHDCILRYTRGVDRLDRELLLSAYHPDAIDDHGAIVAGPEEYADVALAHHAAHQRSTNHMVLNHTCELEGDVAHCETYCVYVGVNTNGTIDAVGNRYIDRFERRDGRWAIAARVCVADWASSLPGEENLDPMMRFGVDALRANATISRDRTDISYMRPLHVTRE